MTPFQKGVKAFAICLAVFIISIIVSSSIYALHLVLWITGGYEEYSTTAEMMTYNYDNISYLDLDLSGTDLEIVEGKEFKVEIDSSKNMDIQNKNNSIKIKDRHRFFWKEPIGRVKIYVPKETMKEVSIDVGAGKICIDGLYTDIFDLDQGAGYVTIMDSNFGKTEIDGGAGKIEFKNTVLRNLDFDAGVGSTNIINSSILGKSEISVGVGSIDIKLSDSIENYTLHTEKGVGTIKVNGTDSQGRIGNGPNYLGIDGGVGSINVSFAN